MLREREPKGPDAEAREEERESAVPGARGKEYSAIEREGDRGQPRKHGGGIGMHGHREHEQHHGKHHGNMHHRARGGYMPEETNASDDGMAAAQPPAEGDGDEAQSAARRAHTITRARRRGEAVSETLSMAENCCLRRLRPFHSQDSWLLSKQPWDPRPSQVPPVCFMPRYGG